MGIQSKQIQWFPGHMAKTRRMIGENLTTVDAVIEILDARIPASSRNPDIDRICGDKPRLVLLNKAGLADSGITDRWVARYTKNGIVCLSCDCQSGAGISRIPSAIRELCSEKLERYRDKGMTGRKLRTMVLGIPNVGKSSLINRLTGAKKAKVENRPGVTLDKQWVATGTGIDLLDMPGVLWPKFDDRRVAENLAITGAIKDAILDPEELASALCSRLYTLCPELLCTRYRLGKPEALAELINYEILELVGRRRGYLVSGGEVDLERTAKMMLDEFRSAKIGRISLEAPKTDRGGCNVGTKT